MAGEDWIVLLVVGMPAAAVAVGGFILLSSMKRESRGLSAFAKELARQRDEARKNGTEFLAPRLLKDTFKD